MSAPLSEHTVYVPPRQTCHVTAEHPQPATKVVLAEITPHRTREALHLSTDLDHVLPPDADSFPIAETKTVKLTIGNCSDTALLCTFEIWGK